MLNDLMGLSGALLINLGYSNRIYGGEDLCFLGVLYEFFQVKNGYFDSIIIGYAECIFNGCGR